MPKLPKDKPESPKGTVISTAGQTADFGPLDASQVVAKTKKGRKGLASTQISALKY